MWSKGCKSESKQKRQGNFLLQSSTLVLLQWHIKDPSHSAKNAGGRLHLRMHTVIHPWPREVWVGWLICPGIVWKQGNKMTCNLSRNAWPQSFRLRGPLWTDLGLRVELVCVSWSYFFFNILERKGKKEEKEQMGMDASKIFHKNPQVRKKPPPPVKFMPVSLSFSHPSNKNYIL